MTLIAKLSSVIIGGTAIAGGAGTTIYFATRGALISDLLKQENKTLNWEDQEWKTGWGKYLGENKNDKWEIGGSLEKENVDPKFKTECENRQHTRVSGKDSQNYKDFVNWCTKSS